MEHVLALLYLLSSPVALQEFRQRNPTNLGSDFDNLFSQSKQKKGRTSFQPLNSSRLPNRGDSLACSASQSVMKALLPTPPASPCLEESFLQSLALCHASSSTPVRQSCDSAGYLDSNDSDFSMTSANSSSSTLFEDMPGHFSAKWCALKSTSACTSSSKDPASPLFQDSSSHTSTPQAKIYCDQAIQCGVLDSCHRPAHVHLYQCSTRG
ncbi:unnamed protein product [Somion occarium]|uniref:Uncharacterized protein n=1 Tax=Somion occarium TaxID=3059160 RepID=A0ABP1CT85_9APHY